MSRAPLSVVVVTWNSESVIEGCLSSLAETIDLPSWELVVVDNASQDRTASEVHRLAPDARLIVNSSNRGLAAANNQGIAASTGEMILISNPDVVYQPGAVAAMMATAERHSEAGWVVPRLLYEDGSLQTSAGSLPTLAEALLGRQVARHRGTGNTSGFWWDGWGHDVEQRIERGHEASYLVRRRAVEEAGLQDERYRLDWEGIDWTDRFARAGWQVWLSPEAQVVHLGGASIRQVPTRAIVLQHLGMYYYFGARRSRVLKPALAGAISLRAAVKIAASLGGLPLYQMGYRRRPAGSDKRGKP